MLISRPSQVLLAKRHAPPSLVSHHRRCVSSSSCLSIGQHKSRCSTPYVDHSTSTCSRTLRYESAVRNPSLASEDFDRVLAHSRRLNALDCLRERSMDLAAQRGRTAELLEELTDRRASLTRLRKAVALREIEVQIVEKCLMEEDQELDTLQNQSKSEIVGLPKVSAPSEARGTKPYIQTRPSSEDVDVLRLYLLWALALLLGAYYLSRRHEQDLHRDQFPSRLALMLHAAEEAQLMEEGETVAEKGNYFVEVMHEILQPSSAAQPLLASGEASETTSQTDKSQATVEDCMTALVLAGFMYLYARQ